MLNNLPGLSSTLSKFSNSRNKKIDLIANNASALLDANPKRMYAAFINNGEDDITLVLQDKSRAVINEGIILKGHGGSYEITLLNLYTGKVSAISASAIQLSFVEGFE
ncbi:MAG: hypothetical protein ACR2LR_17985 [Hassallia sp.]